MISSSFILASLVLAPQGLTAPGALTEAALPFGVDLPLQPGEVLLDSSWDLRPSVPALAAGMGARIDFGAAGIGPATRLLLGSDRLDDVQRTGAALVEATGLAGAAGRVGRGFQYDSGSRLAIALPAADASAFGWSVAFWMRPEPGAYGHTFLQLEGAARATLLGDGRVRVELENPTGPTITSVGAVPAREWTHFTLAYDPTLVGQFRLVLGDSAIGRGLSEGEPDRRPTALVLGAVAGAGFVGVLDELRFEDEPLTTERSLEENRVEPGAGPHTLRARTTLGQRTLGVWARPQRQPVIDTPEEFALGWLDGTVVVDDRLTYAPGRWYELSTTTPPPPRTTHPLTGIGGQRLLLFGGETRDSHLWPGGNTDDTWIFDGATRAWHRVLGPAPAPRCHVPAAYSPEFDLVLLVAGWRNDIDPGLLYSDTWVFDVALERWEQRFPSGIVLPRTSDHTLVWHPIAKVFVMLQGLAVRTYDPQADHWALLAAPTVVDEGGAPSDYHVAGSTAAIVEPSTGLVVLQGGEFSANQPLTYHDRTALYDLPSNTFTVIDPPVRPAPRARAAFAFDPRHQRGVYFGGVRNQFSTRFDDLWTFDLAARRWDLVAASNAPSARGGYYGFVYDEVAQRFLLPLGREAFDRWADDTLALSLDDTRPGKAAFVFDRLGFPGQREWFLEGSALGNSRVTAWFRGGSDGVNWGDWTAAVPASARFVQVGLVLVPGSNGERPSVARFGFR